MAPTTTPTVMLMAAQMQAREMEICAPFQMASKVALPDAPVPRIYLMEKPKWERAARGPRCLASALASWPNRSYSVDAGYR